MICMLCQTTRARHLVVITLQLPRTLSLDSGITLMTNGEYMSSHVLGYSFAYTGLLHSCLYFVL